MPNYLKLYTPQDSAVVFIDDQPQMTFGVANIDRALLINNVTLLAKVAKEFNVPAVLTAVETESFRRFKRCRSCIHSRQRSPIRPLSLPRSWCWWPSSCSASAHYGRSIQRPLRRGYARFELGRDHIQSQSDTPQKSSKP